MSADQTTGDELPWETVYPEAGGEPLRVQLWVGERQISVAESNLTHASSATLRAACKGEGLAVSGTKHQMARRLTAAGFTRAQVEERYGWRARRGHDATDSPR